MSSPSRAASTSTSASAAAPFRPRFRPWPAIGCTPWAASPSRAARGAVQPLGQLQAERIGEDRALHRRSRPGSRRTGAAGGRGRSPAGRPSAPRRAPCVSVQTRLARLSVSGRMANGPPGRKYSWATPSCGALQPHGRHHAGLADSPSRWRRCRPPRGSPSRGPRRPPPAARVSVRPSARVTAAAPRSERHAGHPGRGQHLDPGRRHRRRPGPRGCGGSPAGSPAARRRSGRRSRRSRSAGRRAPAAPPPRPACVPSVTRICSIRWAWGSSASARPSARHWRKAA